MDSKTEEMFEVIKRYMRHKTYLENENELIQQFAEDMIEIDLAHMWMLTQH